MLEKNGIIFWRSSLCAQLLKMEIMAHPRESMWKKYANLVVARLCIACVGSGFDEEFSGRTG